MPPKGRRNHGSERGTDHGNASSSSSQLNAGTTRQAHGPRGDNESPAKPHVTDRTNIDPGQGYGTAWLAEPGRRSEQQQCVAQAVNDVSVVSQKQVGPMGSDQFKRQDQMCSELREQIAKSPSAFEDPSSRFYLGDFWREAGSINEILFYIGQVQSSSILRHESTADVATPSSLHPPHVLASMDDERRECMEKEAGRARKIIRRAKVLVEGPNKFDWDNSDADTGAMADHDHARRNPIQAPRKPKKTAALPAMPARLTAEGLRVVGTVPSKSSVAQLDRKHCHVLKGGGVERRLRTERTVSGEEKLRGKDSR